MKGPVVGKITGNPSAECRVNDMKRGGEKWVLPQKGHAKPDDLHSDAN